MVRNKLLYKDSYACTQTSLKTEVSHTELTDTLTNEDITITDAQGWQLWTLREKETNSSALS